MACQYKLIIETVTIRLPYTVVAEDCSDQATCCYFGSDYICSDNNNIAAEDLCPMGFVTSDTPGFDWSAPFEVQLTTIELPAGAEIVSTDCYTLECGDTVPLDCECS